MKKHLIVVIAEMLISYHSLLALLFHAAMASCLLSLEPVADLHSMHSTL
nr:hypothetical protein [Proteus terrae]